MSTVIVNAGLEPACRSSIGLYRSAGWVPENPAVNSATDPTVLRGPGYVATIVCESYDHDPSETVVAVHLTAT